MILTGGLKAVFLDMDDTLCDTEGLTPRRLAAVRELLEGEVRSEMLDHVIDQAAAWDPLADEETGRVGRIQKMTDALKLGDDQVTRMRARYNEVLFEHLTLQEGVAETLKWLRERVKLGLITNGPSEFQRNKIANPSYTSGMQGTRYRKRIHVLSGRDTRHWHSPFNTYLRESRQARITDRCKRLALSAGFTESAIFDAFEMLVAGGHAGK